MASLGELRAQLDQVDDEIVRLYEERMKLCEAVGEYKVRTGSKVFDRQREREKLADVAAKVSTDFNKKGVQELYQQLMSMSRKLQYQQLVQAGALGRLPFIQIDSLDKENARIVFQGTEGAYSQAAMQAYFGKDCNSFHVRTFRDAMYAIEEGAADYAVLPIENSTAGAVAQMYDLLVEFEILEDGDKSQAAVCSAYAARIHGLSVLKEGINDDVSNSTRFIVVTNQKVFLKEARKISLCLELPHESGSLYHLLSHFIYNDLNMTKIESRPIEGRSWEYRFFIDFEGNLAEAGVKNAIRGLREESRSLKILGNY